MQSGECKLKRTEIIPMAALAQALNFLTRNRLCTNIQKLTREHAPMAQAALDCVSISFALWLAYLIRFDGTLPASAVRQFILFLPGIVLCRLLVNQIAGIYRFVWKFVCLRDIIAMASSFLPVTAVLFALRFSPLRSPRMHFLKLPLSVIVLEFLLALSLCVGARVLARVVQETRHRPRLRPHQAIKRVILYGAGHAGVLLARELSADARFQIVGFVDDDPQKAGTAISGIRVLGTGESLETLVRRWSVEEVIISIAAADINVLARVLSRCRRIPVSTQIVPSLEEIVTKRVKISRVRDVRIEDLLGRSSAVFGEFEQAVLRNYGRKRILITGAGGSIGSELTRQLARIGPAEIAILDKDENSIYELEQQLKLSGSAVRVQPVIADIKVPERMAAVFSEFRPEIVFHAAAHKHVPLMERHPCEAVLNNVLGTLNVLEACRASGTDRFIFISSDKAVNPTNVMGATKRIGEKLVQMHTHRGSLRGTCVRFGNVLGSRGSVIPLFQKQIEMGGPVTVTHPDIMRYLMTIPEAVQLVQLAGGLAAGGEIFVIDMGSPRKILDLARHMIELSGLEPDKDIEIAIIGLRPGEKMNEELAAPHERLIPTCFEKISEIAPCRFDENAFEERVSSAIQLARANQTSALVEALVSMDLGFIPATPLVAVEAAATMALSLLDLN